MLAMTASEDRQVEKLEWLVEPISAEVQMTIESRPEFIDFTMPRLQVKILFQRIAVKITSRQFDNLLQFVNTLDRFVSGQNCCVWRGLCLDKIVVSGQVWVWTGLCLDRFVSGQVCVWTGLCLYRYVSRQVCVWTGLCLNRSVSEQVCVCTGLCLNRVATRQVCV